jgi:hypothetical protein
MLELRLGCFEAATFCVDGRVEMLSFAAAVRFAAARPVVGLVLLEADLILDVATSLAPGSTATTTAASGGLPFEKDVLEDLRLWAM